MWLDCEIQLTGDPEYRRQHGVPVRLETGDGRHPVYQVDVTTVRYDLGQFYAQPAWGVDGPADCYQTGPGYVYCEPQGLAGQDVMVVVATCHESDALRAVRVGFRQLSESSEIEQRLSA